jgi:hypothetical protein
LKNVGEIAEARQKRPKKRSLRAVSEYFEAVFNAASATQVFNSLFGTAKRSPAQIPPETRP